MTKTGRPSKYDPAFCEVVIEAGRIGKSVAWMAAEIGVSKDTIYEWAKTHPEFSDALTHAKLLAQRWWEDRGQEGMEKPGFNGSVWSRSMAARFPEDWRETMRNELTGASGAPIQTEQKTTIDVSNLTDEQLRALASINVR